VVRRLLSSLRLGVVCLFDRWTLERGELRFLPASAATGPGGGQPVDGALGHQRVLELGNRAEDLEEHPPNRGAGVDALIQHDQVDAACLQLSPGTVKIHVGRILAKLGLRDRWRFRSPRW
jgi:hypothetical protein